MISEKTLYWLWLSSLTELNLNSVAALLEAFETPEAAFLSPAGAIRAVEGIRRADAEILERRDLTLARRIPEACAKTGAKIITMDDPEYPRRLKEIFAPPVVLYVRGKLPQIDCEVPVAVVGTRSASPYGLKMGKSIAYEISKCGGVVVSGLTAGIDASAAEGALLADGVCIGVLGTPIDAARSTLARSVCEKGALISEYAPGTHQMKAFFRARNRISAGISVGVVAVEAPEKSGTRLFVAEALEQGKQIFAVPGNADSENSAGTLRFLKEGAQLVTHGWEVAEELSRSYPGVLDASVRKTVPAFGREPEKEAALPRAYVKKPKRLQAAANKPAPAPEAALEKKMPELSEMQKKITDAVRSGKTSTEAIIDATGLSAPAVLAQLTLLEIKGVLKREPGTGFILKS